MAFVLTLSAAVLSERVQRRAPFVFASSSLGIAGYILLLADHRPGVSYLGTIFAAAGIYPATALVLAWPCNNVSGQTKRATATAMQISVGNLGAVMGTQLYRTEWTPHFHVGHGTALGVLAGNICFVAVLWWILNRENRRRDEGLLDSRLDEVAEHSWLGDLDPRWRFRV